MEPSSLKHFVFKYIDYFIDFAKSITLASAFDQNVFIYLSSSLFFNTSRFSRGYVNVVYAPGPDIVFEQSIKADEFHAFFSAIGSYLDTGDPQTVALEGFLLLINSKNKNAMIFISTRGYEASCVSTLDSLISCQQLYNRLIID